MTDNNNEWLCHMKAAGVPVVHFYAELKADGECMDITHTFGSKQVARRFEEHLWDVYGKENVSARFFYDRFNIEVDTSDV